MDPSHPIAQAIDAFNRAVFHTISFAGVEVELIVLWMFLPMVFLTVRFGFINVRGFGLAVRILRGDFRSDRAPGDVTQAQALSTALSGTVGLGNIAGVAVAISLGGPGAAFWMLCIGALAMTLKFTECTLGVKYRRVHEDGSISGGPMYYLQAGLERRGWPRFGAILAWTYAVCAIPSMLQVAQVNQAYSQLSRVTGVDGLGWRWGFGIVLALAVGFVILGGIRSIARVTSRLVPVMAGVYLGAALVVLGTHATEVPRAVQVIVGDALAPGAGVGAVIGAFVWGMRRAVYSTEAGIGSATMAHAAAKTWEPVSEGLVALLEPFIDTVVICSATALVIVVTGAHTQGDVSDIQMTSSAFNAVLPGFDAVLALAVLLFAYSTIVSWAYYASKVWTFVFGDSAFSVTVYRIVFCCALVPGAVLTTGQVFDIMDSLFFLMAVPNVLGLYLMAGEVRRDLSSYLERVRTREVPSRRARP
ncbi:MAG TPA: alanine/glycine:cation symporter family protein [Myxococcales bacterium LLY-WYZ-16_1]|nr:alanine/glycine:cation symporter family protein [Myxococcales bacterium LLY-WYZ-16_1]